MRRGVPVCARLEARLISPRLRIQFVILSLLAVISSKAEEEYFRVTNLWTADIPSYCVSSPALGRDGTIYLGTWPGHLMAFNPDGKLLWKFYTGFEIVSSPAIGEDDTIYFGCRDRSFYAVGKNGKKKWSFKTGAWVDTSAAIGKDGTIYFGSWDRKFYALRPDGKTIWDFSTRAPIVSSPAIDSNGTIFFGSNDKKFYALNPDGSKKWVFAASESIISSPAIASDGALIFTTLDGKLLTLNPDGTKRWELQTGGVTSSSPALAEDGTIYLLANTNRLAVSADGKMKWKEGIWMHPEDEWSETTPAVLSSGVVLFTSGDGLVMAYRSDGRWYWNSWLFGTCRSSPLVREDGTVIAAGTSAKLFAIQNGQPEARLAKSSWPMFRADPQHTGRVAERKQ